MNNDDRHILEERFKEMENEIISLKEENEVVSKQITNLKTTNHPLISWVIVSAIGVCAAMALTSTYEFKNGIPYYKTNPDALISLIGGVGTVAATLYKLKINAGGSN
jgi:hypothetical protein